MIERNKLRWNGWGWAAHQDDIAARAEVWDWLAGELGMPSLLATPARPLDEISLAPSRLYPAIRESLVAIVGAECVRDDKFERAFHALGQSYHDLLRLRAGDLSRATDAVVYPRSGDEVLALLAFASERSLAIVPYGGGTSVVGGVTAERGAFEAVIAMDLSGMSQVLGVDAEARTASAEAGIYGPAFEKALQAQGFTLGHYPQSFEFSTLGGWIAHRGAGQQSNRYGKAEDWLLAATLATPRGFFATKDFPASAAGPRLTDLIAGSEGAFGILTDATVRIHEAPERIEDRAYLFRDFAGGAQAIRETVQAEIPVAMLRLSDAEETRFYRAFGSVGKRPSLSDWIAKQVLATRKFTGEACALIASFEGDKASVRSSCKRFSEIAKRHGAMSLGAGPGARWRHGRFHGPYLRDPMLDRGLGVDTLETATTWPQVSALYEAVRKALQTAILETVPRPGARGVVLCHLSHSYPDGASLYFTYIFPRALDREIAQWQTIKRAATDAIAANGGTISHHHGVGEDHLPWMAQEKGELGVEVLRAIKRTLDPKGILNPGKLIPP
jgi:alkyldihydroxyacetonephosphate synthase